MNGYKTLIFAALISVLGVLQQSGVQLVPQDYQGVYIAGIGLITALLRVVTSTPVLNKQK